MVQLVTRPGRESAILLIGQGRKTMKDWWYVRVSASRLVKVRLSVRLCKGLAVSIVEKAKAAGNDNMNGDHNVLLVNSSFLVQDTWCKLRSLSAVEE
jgi:hypothetical protein